MEDDPFSGVGVTEPHSVGNDLVGLGMRLPGLRMRGRRAVSATDRLREPFRVSGCGQAYQAGTALGTFLRGDTINGTHRGSGGVVVDVGGGGEQGVGALRGESLRGENLAAVRGAC